MNTETPDTANTTTPSVQSMSGLRLVSFIEGLSLLILFFVAMPMKYIGGNPDPVRFVGMAHGVLFLIFCAMIMISAINHKWSFRFSVMAGLSSIVPFGMLYLDRKLR